MTGPKIEAAPQLSTKNLVLTPHFQAIVWLPLDTFDAGFTSLLGMLRKLKY